MSSSTDKPGGKRRAFSSLDELDAYRDAFESNKDIFEEIIAQQFRRAFNTGAGPHTGGFFTDKTSDGERYTAQARADRDYREHRSAEASRAWMNGHEKVTWFDQDFRTVGVAGVCKRESMVEVLPGSNVFHKDAIMTSLRGCRIATAYFLINSSWKDRAEAA